MRFAVFLLFFLHGAGIYAQCSNIGFESSTAGSYTSATAVNGWSISSQTATSCNSNNWVPGSNEFSIVTTPVSDPFLYFLPNSPLGGTKVARINDNYANSNCTRLTTTISVISNSNTLLQTAFAGVFQDGSHTCCQEARVELSVRTASGSLLFCMPLILSGQGSVCSTPSMNYTVSNGATWSNWQLKYVDLTPYIGSNVVLEIMVFDCALGDHYGTFYFDAACPAPGPNCFCSITQPYFIPHSMCAGTSTAIISAPLGYQSYTWTAPSGYPIPPSQATLSTITVTNGLAGNVYSVTMMTAGGCTVQYVDTLSYTQVNIIGIGSSSTCSGGANGTATVVASGSGIGYNYTWVNGSNSIVATTNTVQNLSAGVYSVTVSSISGCGIASGTIAVNVIPLIYENVLKPYCSGQPSFLGSIGSNHTWYFGSTPVPSITAANYTVANPCQGCVVIHTFYTALGCRDSVKYTFAQTTPGTITASFVKPVCPGASNGTAVVNMTVSNGSPPGSYSYSITATGTTPAYYAGTSMSSSNSFTVGGLSAGTYSVYASDGNCSYSKTLNVNSFSFDYTVNVSTNTVCTGGIVQISTSFTSPPTSAQYSYSWTPTTWMPGGNGTLQNFLLLTNTSQSATTIIYTVVVTPSLVNCPKSKTISVTVYNPPPPVISQILPICQSVPQYTNWFTPPGGVFSGGNYINSNTGIITPSLAPLGESTFSYNVNIFGCPRSAAASFTVLPAPLLNLTGTPIICRGDTATITAFGANTYSWSTGDTSSTVLVSAVSDFTPSVTGAWSVNSCTASNSFPIHVISPTISVTGNTMVCKGLPASLTAHGAATYTWSYFATGSVLTFTPPSDETFTVIGKESVLGCVSTATVAIKVVDTPTLFVVGNTEICKGTVLSLVAGGAEACSWGGLSGCTFTAIPLQTTQYTLTGTNAGICSSSTVITINVSECLSLNAESVFVHSLVYPNPATDEFIVKCSTPARLIIYSVDGKLVGEYVLDPGQNAIPAGDFPRGVYTVTIVEEEYVSHQKLILTERD